MLMFILCFFAVADAEQLYYNDAYHYYDAGEIGLKVDGKDITGLPMKPVIINDYTMVPVRELFEAIGCEVIWHDDTCQAEIKVNGVSVKVKIGDRNVDIDGKHTTISEPQPLPMLIGNSPQVLKTMVPVRFISEKLGFKVNWDNNTRTVLIDTGVSEDPDLIIGTTDPESGNGTVVMPEKEGAFGTVVAESDKKYDYVYISTKYGASPEITRYSNPERVVFDFPKATFMDLGGTLSLKGNTVDTVRYSNYEGHARLVLDVSADTQVCVMSSSRGILIRAEESKNENIVYDVYKGRIYFNKSYVGSGKKVTGGYKVSFTNLKLKDQTIEINDSFIKSIIIEATNSGCNITVMSDYDLTYTAEKGFCKAEASDDKEENPPIVSNSNCIVIDAGHGGHDPGAVGYNSEGKAVAYESHINLAIALLVGEKLEKSGIDVAYTRKSDKYVTLQERSELANELECKMFVSIHCNSIDKADIDGTQVYYHPASEYGTVLAKNIYGEVVDRTGLSPKKIQNGSHLYVIRTTTSPAVLVECAFISNESDREYLLSKQGQEELAESIYQGIMKSIK